MAWTIDRTTGLDFIAATEIVAGPTASSTIFLPGTSTVVSNVSVTGYEWFTATDLAFFVGDGASDRLIGSANNDLVVWDAGTLNNFLFSDIVSLGRARLPTATAAQRLEVFDLGAGNDLLNLTANTASLASGASPGVYNFAVTAYGGTGNDILATGEQGDTLYGGVNNDVVWGFGGDDIAFGDADNDTLYGGDGVDSLFGGTGLDTLYGGAGNDALAFNPDNGQGIFAFVVSLWSGEGTNPGSAVTLAGGSGYNWSNDVFLGGTAIDTVSLTNGNDLLLFNTGDLSIGGVSNASVSGRFAEVEVFNGGGGNDIIQLNDANNGATFDPLAVSLFGGHGNDILVAALGDDLVVGNNAVAGPILGDIDTLYGGGGNDTIFGDAQGETLSADGAGDTIYGGGGTDTAFGNAGDDLIFGDNAGAVTQGGDSLFGGTGNDTLFGAGGGDTIGGDTGIDSLFGGGGLDTLFFTGDASFTADGNDFVHVRDGEVGGVSSTIAISAGLTAYSFDYFQGDGGTDTLQGDNGANIIALNTGDLTVDGAPLADSGGHILSTEVFVLGGGNDILLLNDATQNVVRTDAATAFGGAGADLIVSGTGADLLAGGEPAGGAAAGGDRDTVFGGAGNDTIYGDVQGETTTANGSFDTLYGGSGDDTLFGNAGDDLLYGSSGIDSLDGGLGDDTLFVFPDNSTVGNGATDFVQGWDGESGSQAFSYNGLTANWSFDRYEGGDGQSDTLVGGDRANVILANTDDFYIDGVAQAGNANRLAGIEIVLLGAGADILLTNDPTGQTTTGTVYATGITVAGGDGADTVVTGAGNDVLYGFAIGVGAPGDLGDYLAAGAGTDTLFGDEGDDRLFGGSGGDSVYGGAGNDTIFGGEGGDVLRGEAGNDVISDSDDGILRGGDGSDLLLLSLADLGSSEAQLFGGDNVGTDGDDSVFVTGYYAKVDSSLGAGNDRFISLAVGDDGNGNSGDRVDRVAGDDGDDVISTWFGNDSIDGGAGGDALWGGAGVDTIMGGADGDILYGGAGDGDLLIGGDGSDYYYWARTDGIDLINDDDTVAGGEGDNYILVFSGYDGTGQMPAGTGVFETDQDLYDNAGDDMVQLVDLDGAGAGTMYRMTILQGAGAGSSIEFDQTEISVIGLWNHDATAGTQVVTVYAWDPIDGRYEYQA